MCRVVHDNIQNISESYFEKKAHPNEQTTLQLPSSANVARDEAISCFTKITNMSSSLTDGFKAVFIYNLL